MKKEIRDLQKIVNRLKTKPIAAEKSELEKAATLFMEGFNQINSILKDYEAGEWDNDTKETVEEQEIEIRAQFWESIHSY